MDRAAVNAAEDPKVLPSAGPGRRPPFVKAAIEFLKTLEMFDVPLGEPTASPKFARRGAVDQLAPTGTGASPRLEKRISASRSPPKSKAEYRRELVKVVQKKGIAIT
jgi:hypothetical protein